MSKTATLCRMATADHTCPYGLKSKWLLVRRGYAVDDRLFETREQTDAFKAVHDVETTPRWAVEGERTRALSNLDLSRGARRANLRP